MRAGGRGGLGSAVGTVVQAGRDFREVASAVVDTMTPVVEPLATPLHHLLDKTLFARRLAEDSAHVLLSLGQHVPLIQPICFALKALLVVVQSVRVHKKRVAAFSERVTELSRTIMELAATTRPEQGGGATANMLSSHLDRFKTVLDQCKTTLDVFAGRKFVMRMVMGRRDIETLAQLDNRLTTCITDLQPALQAQVLTIQQVSYSAMTDANAAIMEQLMALQERNEELTDMIAAEMASRIDGDVDTVKAFPMQRMEALFAELASQLTGPAKTIKNNSMKKLWQTYCGPVDNTRLDTFVLVIESFLLQDLRVPPATVAVLWSPANRDAFCRAIDRDGDGQVCVAEVNALMSEPDTPFVELLELAVSRRDAAPYLVGPPPTPYFGYKTQLRSLVEMLTRPYSRAFVSLGGHAGCGMKSFLRVAAASLRDFGCYPGGIYYLDLHGTEQEDVAARCERELLLLTGSAASSLDAWCRTLTQRACVLIDGGSTLSSDLKAVFRPFVGTTLNVVGASVASTELECDLWLGGLDADSVSALVQQLAPYLLTSCGLDCVMRRTSALPEAIMRVCRMTPSAAVAALKHDGPLFPDPSRPMGLTASGLHDSPTFSAVDARTTAAMAKLRVFPGSFDIAAASDVLGYRDYADTTDLLAKLVGLEWLHDKGDGRWMCNNNVPTTVNNAPVSVDVLAAFVRYYVALINETERQFVGSSPSTGLTLFDTERDSINKVLGMFVTAASQPERVLQELVALRSFEILHARLTHEELEAVIAGIGTALESLHYFASPLVGYHLYAKGRAHHHNPTVAIDCFSKAIGMFLPASAYVKEIALCNLGLADVQRQQGDLAEARSTLEAAIASVIGNDVDVAFLRARLYMELGSVWMDLHESRKAISQYSDALINLVYAIPQLGDHVLVATLKARTGKAHVAQQKYAEAWKELEEAMRSRRKMFGAVHEEIAATMEERGECALAWCRYDLAVSEFQAAVDTYTTVYGDQHVAVARAMIGLAKAQASAGDLDTADATYTASLRILRGQPSPPACIKDALMNFAELKIVLGDPDASAALQREATTLPRFDSRRFIVPRPSPRRESSLSSLLPVPGSPVAVRPPAPPAARVVPPGWRHEKDTFVCTAAKVGLVVMEDDDLLIITVKDRHVVVMYSLSDGTPLKVIGRKGSGPLEFDQPLRIRAVPSSKHLLVCDYGNNRLQEITMDGVFVGEVAVQTPWDVAVRHDLGLLFVASGSCINVLAHSTGEPIFACGQSLGACTSIALAADLSFLCGTPDAVVKMTCEGAVTSRFNCRSMASSQRDAVALSNGETVVSDGETCKLVVFAADGGVVKECGTKGGAEPGHFQAPSALHVCGSRLFVLDAGSARLQVFCV